MSYFFNTFLYKPLFNFLILLYNYASFYDLGIAIILLTILVRFILYPLFYKSFKNQILMQKLQPEIQKIQRNFKNNKEKQAQELLKLYQQHKVNPFSGFLLLLVQLPILIALYRVFLNGFSTEAFVNLYSFVIAPEKIHSLFLGLIDLKTSSILIISLAALAQYFQGRFSLVKSNQNKDQEEGITAKISRQMVFVGPVITVIFLSSLPSAVGLYWLTTTLFSIGQQWIINRKLKIKDNLQG